MSPVWSVVYGEDRKSYDFGERGNGATVFFRIRNRDDAIQIVRDASTVYFTLAAFQLVLAFTGKFDSFSLFILADVIVNAVAGAVLRRFESRAAAIVLLLNLLLAFILGDGPILHALLLWPAFRAFEATWRMHSGMSLRTPENSAVDTPAAR